MNMERQSYTHLAALIGSREEISNVNVNWRWGLFLQLTGFYGVYGLLPAIDYDTTRFFFFLYGCAFISMSNS